MIFGGKIKDWVIGNCWVLCIKEFRGGFLSFTEGNLYRVTNNTIYGNRNTYKEVSSKFIIPTKLHHILYGIKQ